MEITPQTLSPPSALQKNPLSAPDTAAGAGSDKPKFNDVWKKIQTDMGAPEQKPREVKKTLDKDDFMRIMLTQMQHQDPTNPFDSDKMAQEIAQITSLEQMKNVSEALKTLSTQNKPLERLAMTHLIGKTVTVDSSRFPHKQGTKEAITFELPEAASEVQIALISERGEVVLEQNLGAHPEGKNVFDWDGKKSNTLPAEGGKYFFRISAKNQNSSPMATSTVTKKQVVGIGYEGGEPTLLVGDGQSQSQIDMNNIIRIEDGSAAMLAPSGASNPLGSALPAGIQDLLKKDPKFQAVQNDEDQSPSYYAHPQNSPLRRPQPSEAAPPPSIRPLAAQIPPQPPVAPKKFASASPFKFGDNGEKGFPNGLPKSVEDAKVELPSGVQKP